MFYMLASLQVIVLEVMKCLPREATAKQSRSNHEEADTRLILHAKYAAATHNNVIIKSPDSDVPILSIAMQQMIENEIFFSDWHRK